MVILVYNFNVLLNILYSSSKFVSDKWMADHKFMDLAEFQEKQWYVANYNCL